ncbi:ParA family protein [Enterobacter bugandensis]|uniref:ParA family protein n=1 Tax=Enterobacter bugandensis TaxID=881260 RepID=UPI002005C2B4|nr:ParA family protein [Enterobacter bugandensis]MCK7435929.1 ParA family protein [Enterobacter bugandensis]
MLKIAVLAGKGGVKKSSLSRTLAARLVQRGLSVAGFDTDIDQASFARWMQRRINNGIEPTFPVMADVKVNWIRTKLDSLNYDAVVIDGAAYASKDTPAIAEVVDLVVIPTGYSVDDIEATLRVAKALIAEGIPNRKILIALWSVLESKPKHRDTVTFLEGHNFNVTADFVPLRPSYSAAMDFGYALTEVNAAGLRTTARTFIDGVINHAIEVKNGKAQRTG